MDILYKFKTFFMMTASLDSGNFLYRWGIGLQGGGGAAARQFSQKY